MFSQVQEQRATLFASLDRNEGTGIERDVTDRHAALPRRFLARRLPSTSARNSARCSSVMRLPAKSQSSAAWRFASLAMAAGTRVKTVPMIAGERHISDSAIRVAAEHERALPEPDAPLEGSARARRVHRPPPLLATMRAGPILRAEISV